MRVKVKVTMKGRSRASVTRLLALAGAVLGSSACSSSFGPGRDAVAAGPRSCLSIEASPNLNLFDGQSHVVVLYFYPLQSALGFETADLRDLANGAKPSGLVGERFEATILPDSLLELKEPLPREATRVGVLADFYRGPRKVLVSVECKGERLLLSAGDVQLVSTRGERR